MRITNGSLNRTFIRNLNKNLNQMQKYQDQLTSGKQVSKPSDNPLLVGKIMGMSNHIAENEQYNANISDSLGWVQTQDTALGEAAAAMRRIKDLAIRGANDTMAEDDRLALKNEIEQQIEHIVDVFNTNFDGRYVFAGQATTTKPFEVSRPEDGNISIGLTIKDGVEEDLEEGVEKGVVEKKGINKDLEREIANGVSIKLITGSEHLTQDKNAENENLGDMLTGLLDAFDSEDPSTEINDLLGDIDSHTDNLVRVRTRIGAIDNRLESALARNKAENLNLKEVLSEKEDVDIVEKYMESIVASSVYQASLSIGSKIIQPTLLDFVR